MITLYQFESCPFCSKVRTMLNYINQPYDIVEVSPFGMKELEFTEHKKVPVLKDGETVITESARIIDYINEHYAKFPTDEHSKTWTDWLDNTLVHYITPLVHPNYSTSKANFKHIIKTGQYGALKTAFFRFAGAIAMPKVAKKLQAKYDIKDAKSEYLAAIDHWVNKGLAGKTFYGGEQPNFVDCSVFGVLSSCQKLGPVDLAKQHNARFNDWYQACASTLSSTNHTDG